MCKLLAQHYNVVVIDMDALVQPVLAKIEKERLDKVKEETTRDAIEKIKMEIESGKLTSVPPKSSNWKTLQRNLVW